MDKKRSGKDRRSDRDRRNDTDRRSGKDRRNFDDNILSDERELNYYMREGWQKLLDRYYKDK